VTKEVGVLLLLKAEFKTMTGQEWKPSATPASAAAPAPAPVAPATPSSDLDARINKQGELVRDLKAKKASKEEVTKEVGVLLALKNEFKTLTGQEWKPSATPTAAAPAAAPAPAPVASKATEAPSASPSSDLDAKITKQGELVRDLKAKKASKDEVTKEVGVLLALKTEFKTMTGQEWKPSAAPAPAAVPAAAAAATKAEKAPKPEKPKQEPKAKKQQDEKKQTRLGLEAKKEENLPDWYSQVAYPFTEISQNQKRNSYTILFFLNNNHNYLTDNIS